MKDENTRSDTLPESVVKLPTANAVDVLARIDDGLPKFVKLCCSSEHTSGDFDSREKLDPLHYRED